MIKLRQKTKAYNANYTRIYKEKLTSEESEEEMELFVKNKPKRNIIPTIDKVIEDGDTLQSLAIRYGCSIADLKRLNNIDKENEIFAKRIIKVPHKPFSMAIAGVHVSGRSSPESGNQSLTNSLIDISTLNSKLNNNTLFIENNPVHEVNQIIFNSQIIQDKCERVQETIGEVSSDEKEQLLPNRNGSTPDTTDRVSLKVISTLTCSGADADISWVGLIVCIIVLIFAFPLIYVLYIAEHIESYQHHGS